MTGVALACNAGTLSSYLSEYERVEYVQTTADGGEYVDTGYYTTNNVKVAISADTDYDIVMDGSTKKFYLNGVVLSSTLSLTMNNATVTNYFRRGIRPFKSHPSRPPLAAQMGILA